jgi:hypothetical protein
VDNVCVQNKVPPGTQQLLGIGTAANIKEPWRMLSSGMWHHVALASNNVLGEHIA